MLLQNCEQQQYRGPGEDKWQLARPARLSRATEASGPQQPQGAFCKHGDIV